GIRDRNVTGVQTCALPISYDFSAKLKIYNEKDDSNSFLEILSRLFMDFCILFCLFYLISFMIRFRFTVNIAIAPCISMLIRPEDFETSYPCLRFTSLFFASLFYYSFLEILSRLFMDFCILFCLFYLISFMIRFRFTVNIAMAPCISMLIRPEDFETSYPCLCFNSLFFASIL